MKKVLLALITLSAGFAPLCAMDATKDHNTTDLSLSTQSTHDSLQERLLAHQNFSNVDLEMGFSTEEIIAAHAQKQYKREQNDRLIQTGIALSGATAALGTFGWALYSDDHVTGAWISLGFGLAVNTLQPSVIYLRNKWEEKRK